MKRELDLKHRIITFYRILKAGAHNVFRNAWLSIAAIAVMLVALVIILFTVVLNVTANNAIGELSKNLKVSIYLKDNANPDVTKELQKALLLNPEVQSVDYVSKDVAKERFSSSFKNDAQLLEGLTLLGGDTLPASYEISVKDLSKLGDIEKVAKQEQFSSVVDSITLGRTDARKTIDRAASVQKFITSASIVAASIFTVISILIIFNTIRIAIYTRNEEIRNMKLIGATPGYIRGPFLVETAIYGVVAGIIASTAVYSIILSIGTKISSQAEFSATYEFFTKPSTMIVVYLATILVGILVGMFSSALAMEKYLKLKRW